MLCGIGVYLGRFLRWNSWDLLHKPLAIMVDIMEVAVQPAAYSFVIGFSVFLCVAYSLFYVTNRAQK